MFGLRPLIFANAFRPKQGLELPLHSWFNHSSDEAGKIRDRLTDPAAKIGAWFDQQRVHRNLNKGRVVDVWLEQQAGLKTASASGVSFS